MLSILASIGAYSQEMSPRNQALKDFEEKYQNAPIEDRAGLTIEMAKIYSSFNLDSAEWVLQRGIDYVREKGSQSGEAQLQNGMGIISYMSGDLSKALSHYERAK